MCFTTTWAGEGDAKETMPSQELGRNLTYLVCGQGCPGTLWPIPENIQFVGSCVCDAVTFSEDMGAHEQKETTGGHRVQRSDQVTLRFQEGHPPTVKHQGVAHALGCMREGGGHGKDPCNRRQESCWRFVFTGTHRPELWALFNH